MLLNSASQPFYVGRTTDPKRRLRGHLDEAHSGCDCTKCQAIRAAWAAGGIVRIVPLQTVDDEAESRRMEVAWAERIGWYRLTNIYAPNADERPRHRRKWSHPEMLTPADVAVRVGIRRSTVATMVD